MKIGMLTQWFDPESGPAGLPGVYAREFSRQGHEVKVLAGYPNYPDGVLYPGYRMKMRGRETLDGIPVTRVPLYPSHSRSGVARIANYASFALSAATFGATALRGADALYVYNSPVSVVLPQLVSSRWGRVPVFLHVQDLWPESLIESGMFPGGRVGDLASRVIQQVVNFMEARSAVIGVISPGVRELIIQRNPNIDPARIVYVPNPANEAIFSAVPALRLQAQRASGTRDYVEFMYAGAMGDVQGLETVIAAAELLRDRDDIRLTLVGDGTMRPRLQEMAESRGLSNVDFLGRVPQTEIPRLMARADVQLVSLAANPFLRYTTPSKIASLLASEVPIVAQIAGDGASLIEAANAGFVTHPGDAPSLADALARMAGADPVSRTGFGLNGRRFYEKELSAGRAASRITSALTQEAS